MQNVKRAAVLLTVLSVGVVGCGGGEDFISVGDLQHEPRTAEERAEESWSTFDSFYGETMPEVGWDTSGDGEVDAWRKENESHNIWFYDTDLNGIIDHMQTARKGSSHLESFYWAGEPGIFGYDTDGDSEADLFGILREDSSYHILQSWEEVKNFVEEANGSVISEARQAQ